MTRSRPSTPEPAPNVTTPSSPASSSTPRPASSVSGVSTLGILGAMTSSDDPEGASDTSTGNVDAGLMRSGGLSYLHLPATDVRRAALFYEQVFGWNVRGHDTARPSFDDGTGHVSGAWMTDQAVSAAPGILPYVYVDRIDDTIERIT